MEQVQALPLSKVKPHQAVINRKRGVLMKELFLALFAGLIVGMLFKFLKLPLPAPPVLPGVIGIFGVYLGGIAVEWIAKLIQH